MTTKPKVVLGLSGGVDSAVAAELLSRDYEVHGLYLDIGLGGTGKADAAAVARRLGIPFHTADIRQALERPEAMDAGTIILTGLDPEIVLDSVRLVIDEFEQNGGKYEKICPEYQVPNTSWRVLKLILGTARLSNRWRGIELKK